MVVVCGCGCVHVNCSCMRCVTSWQERLVHCVGEHRSARRTNCNVVTCTAVRHSQTHPHAQQQWSDTRTFVNTNSLVYGVALAGTTTTTTTKAQHMSRNKGNEPHQLQAPSHTVIWCCRCQCQCQFHCQCHVQSSRTPQVVVRLVRVNVAAHRA